MRDGEPVLFRCVDYLLRPKSIAIIGASDSSRGGWARDIYENLEYCGFPARLYLVNPKRTELWGRKVYANFAALPEPVDLALTIIPSPSIPDTLAEGYKILCDIEFAVTEHKIGPPDTHLARAQSFLERAKHVHRT